MRREWSAIHRAVACQARLVADIEVAHALRDAGGEPDLIDGLGEAPVLRYPAQLCRRHERGRGDQISRLAAAV